MFYKVLGKINNSQGFIMPLTLIVVVVLSVAGVVAVFSSSMQEKVVAYDGNFQQAQKVADAGVQVALARVAVLLENQENLPVDILDGETIVLDNGAYATVLVGTDTPEDSNDGWISLEELKGNGWVLRIISKGFGSVNSGGNATGTAVSSTATSSAAPNLNKYLPQILVTPVDFEVQCAVGNRTIDSQNNSWQIELLNATWANLSANNLKQFVQLTDMPSGLNYTLEKVSATALRIIVSGTAAEAINSEQTLAVQVLSDAVNDYLSPSDIIELKLVPYSADIYDGLEGLINNQVVLFATLRPGSSSTPALNIQGSSGIVGTVGTNATGTGSVSFGGSKSAIIDGDLYLGYGADLNNVISVKANREDEDIVTQGHIIGNNAKVISFLAPVFPEFPEGLPQKENFTTPWTETGYYEIKEDGEYNLIEVTNNRTLAIDLQGGTRIIRTKQFDVQGEVILKNVGRKGKLMLYIDESFHTSGNHNINVNGEGAGNAGAFNMFIKGNNPFGGKSENNFYQFNLTGNVFTENGDVIIGGSSKLKGNIVTGGKTVIYSGSSSSIDGLVYALNADVYLRGSGSVKGILVAKSFSLTGDSAIVFKEPDLSSLQFVSTD